MNPRQKRRPGRSIEAFHHMSVARWMDVLGIFFAHYPSGEDRSISTGAKLKKMGVKPGIPDFLIFDPPPRAPFLRGTVLEMKGPIIPGDPSYRPSVSSEQKDRLIDFWLRGWLPLAAYGSRQAIEYLEHWGYGKRNVSADCAIVTGRDLLTELRQSEPFEGFLKAANKDILAVTGIVKPV